MLAEDMPSRWHPMNDSSISSRLFCREVQRSTEVGAPGSVYFIHAIDYHFCLNMPEAFTQPGALRGGMFFFQIVIFSTHEEQE